MPGGWTMSMAWMRTPQKSWVESEASFIGMWIVMMIAMMMPSLVSALRRYREVMRRTGEGAPGSTNRACGCRVLLRLDRDWRGCLCARCGTRRRRDGIACPGSRRSGFFGRGRPVCRHASVLHLKLEKASPCVLAQGARPKRAIAYFLRMPEQRGNTACNSVFVAATVVLVSPRFCSQSASWNRGRWHS